MAIICLLSFNKSFTQAKSIFFEMGGPGVASFNFDTRLADTNKGLGARVGIGFNGFSNGSVILIPIGINYLLTKDDKNYFEIGGGFTVLKVGNIYNNSDFSNSFGHLNFGYRFQPKEGGFLFRAALVPIFGKDFFWPYYAGISFGYSF